MTIEVHSQAFGNGGKIPIRHTCDGDNIAPPLDWKGAPKETKSFALIMEDPDAPSGTFRHWGLYNVAPERGHLPEATTQGSKTERFGTATNDFGSARYDGPKPPKGHGIHHYHFKILALDIPHLTVPDHLKVEDLWQAVEGHVLDQGELVGLYER